MSSKQDYEATARIIADPAMHLNAGKRRALAGAFADHYAAGNPRFDRGQFYAACGAVIRSEPTGAVCPPHEGMGRAR